MQSAIPLFRGAAETLTQADQDLAKTALDEAKLLTPPKKGDAFKKALKNAEKEYNDGMADVEAGRLTQAITDFKQSWIHSRQAAHLAGGDDKWSGGTDISTG